jgi:hypothetical protein
MSPGNTHRRVMSYSLILRYIGGGTNLGQDPVGKGWIWKRGNTSGLELNKIQRSSIRHNRWSWSK